MSATGGSEREALRAAVGADNYPHIEEMAALLDRLSLAGVITTEGATNVLAALADEMVMAAIASEFGEDLLAAAGVNDTATLEDTST